MTTEVEMCRVAAVPDAFVRPLASGGDLATTDVLVARPLVSRCVAGGPQQEPSRQKSGDDL